MSGGGEAKIKSEYLIPAVGVEGENGVKVSDLPAISNLTAEKRRNQEPDDTFQVKRPKWDRTGQNKHRPGPHKFANDGKLCPLLHDGNPDVKCGNSSCPFMHDIQEYLASKTRVLPDVCPNYSRNGKCLNGLACVFAASHTNSENQNVVNQELWEQKQADYEKVHRNFVDKDTRTVLRKKQYDFSKVDKLCQDLLNAKSLEAKSVVESNAIKTFGAFTDEDNVGLRPAEIRKIQWQDKLYLSPLTTVGNLPFRRICVDFGADITCSEMSLATSLLQGSFHEYALLKRHPSEKIWGIQICANNGFIAAKTAKLLADLGVDYDFIDLNMGCPLEPIFVQGAGSGLMCRKNKFQGMVKCMTGTLKALGKPFTVKMRTGIKLEKNFAHELIPVCRDLGVDMVTLHGRTKDQRYLKHANWDYIGECKKVASPMPLFGNGDVLSYEDYVESKKLSGVDGVMIGRGALTKPWIFQEIKENRHIDLSSSERLDIVRRYCNYGLEHWGSDSQGVEATRKFLLEWLSFTHRYIPYGILEEPPQRINQRPPKYFGRDDMETLLASPIVTDWIKISEMFLGPIPDGFQFLPKHKANSWG